MQEPLPITVIIPCYNMANTLARAVESALEAGACEVVIVDDDSTDESFGVASRLEDIYPNVSLIGGAYGVDVDHKLGVAFSRNMAVDHSEDLIVPLDADDTLTPDGLRLLYYAYEPGTWVYGGWCERVGQMEKDYQAPPPGMLKRKNVCFATMLFHRDDWQKAGGYNPLFEIGAEDYAFQCALTHAGVKPVRVNGIIHNRYTNGGGGGRSARAAKLWPQLHELAQELYPNAFV